MKNNQFFQIEPIKGNRNESVVRTCSKASCKFNFQVNCPGPLRVKHENNVIACHSPCNAFGIDEHCCQQKQLGNSTPEVCRSLEWRDIQPGHFKQFCPDAITYLKDPNIVFSCKADSYRIQFGGSAG